VVGERDELSVLGWGKVGGIEEGYGGGVRYECVVGTMGGKG